MSNVTINTKEPPIDMARANEIISQLKDMGFAGMEVQGNELVIYVSIEELIARIFDIVGKEIGSKYEIDWEKRRIKFNIPLNIAVQNIINK